LSCQERHHVDEFEAPPSDTALNFIWKFDECFDLWNSSQHFEEFEEENVIQM
jgi:hypothetical protein